MGIFKTLLLLASTEIYARKKDENFEKCSLIALEYYIVKTSFQIVRKTVALTN